MFPFTKVKGTTLNNVEWRGERHCRLNKMLFLIRYTASFKGSLGSWRWERRLLAYTPGWKWWYLFVPTPNESDPPRNHRRPSQRHWIPAPAAPSQPLRRSLRPDGVFRASPSPGKEVSLLFSVTGHWRLGFPKVAPLGSCGNPPLLREPFPPSLSTPLTLTPCYGPNSSR